MSSVADFLRERLENAGVKHVIGLPGDFIIPFFPKLLSSKKLTLINCADESCAGFIADGYARTNGIGCVAVTYNVGALKLCNSIAGAYRERSPVVIISGAPGMTERNSVQMHNTVGSFDCQREVFKNFTCAHTVLENPLTAGYEIDRCFDALKFNKQPVYIELPRDVADQPIGYDVYSQGTPRKYVSDEHNILDSVQEVSEWINSSQNPLILAGVEIARYQMGKDLIKFAERAGIPIACTLLSKSVVNETHPLFAGVYAGANSSQASVRDLVDNSDCLLVLGEVISEATVGYRASKAFWKRDMITATVGELKVKNHTYPQVSFHDFCKALFKLDLKKRTPIEFVNQEIRKFEAAADQKLTTRRFFEKINSILDEKSIVVADTGDSMFGASDLKMPTADSFFAPALYMSMGWAIPAAVGVQLAKPKSRPIVVVGDGALQMSISEISTMFKYGLNPIIFVLNNRGYTTERMILEGSFNDIVDWHYQQIPNLIGGGKGFRVTTESELETAVDTALSSNVFCILNCVVEPMDISPALQRIGEAMAKKAK